MAVKIYVEPDEAYDFFLDNISRLEREMVLIAENEETQYAVFITERGEEPLFAVCKGDEQPEYEVGATDELDCVNTVELLYVQYLYPVTVFDGHCIQLDDVDSDKTELAKRDELEEEIGGRENELIEALCEFLSVVLQDGFDEECYDSQMVSELLDQTLQYLSDVWGYSIFRPMFITDTESGVEVYSEFPYDGYELLEVT